MISSLLRAVALLAALLPLAQTQAQSPFSLPFTGTVTDAAGKPIAGVRVTSLPVDDSRTDASGHYTLTKPRDLVRFSMAGYRPVTKTLASLSAPVIMQPATERPRTIAECPAAVKNDKRQAHMTLRIALAREAKIKSEANIDNPILAVKYRVDWMIHGSGAQWTYGVPEWKLWKEFVTVEERDILVDDPAVTIADYSGLLRNGSHVRYIGVMGQSIAYTDAAADAAAYFDNLLETLCWNR
jgi:hypothetical protein